MKQKAAEVASAKKYIVVGCSCLDVQKSAYEALAQNRIGNMHSLIAQSALRISEPNAWLRNLPSAISSINWYIGLTGGNNQIEAPKLKPVIIVLPLEDITPKNENGK